MNSQRVWVSAHEANCVIGNLNFCPWIILIIHYSLDASRLELNSVRLTSVAVAINRWLLREPQERWMHKPGRSEVQFFLFFFSFRITDCMNRNACGALRHSKLLERVCFEWNSFQSNRKIFERNFAEMSSLARNQLIRQFVVLKMINLSCS